MKKFSAMGGGEFEYCPHKLDEKVTKRVNYIEDSYKHIKQELDKVCIEYQKSGLGTFEGIREDIVRLLVLEMRK